MTEAQNKIEGAPKRIIGIDILRGFAVFGVLIVNAPSMNSPVIKDGNAFAFLHGAANQIYAGFLSFVAVGYFYPIFASLFGVAAAMILLKNGKRFFLRRMAILFLFGLCQGILIWWGDVLAIYALLGVLLSAFYGRSNKIILKIFYAAIALSLMISLASLVFIEGASLYPKIDVTALYQNGSFFMITQQRIMDYLWTYAPWLVASIDRAQFLHTMVFVVELFLCFVSGFYLYSSGLLKRVVSDKSFVLKALRWAMFATFAISLLKLLWPYNPDVLEIADSYARAMTYACIILFACHYRNCLAILEPLSFVGKMSLSNYLFHNFVLSLTLYGYGLGFYGKIGPFDQVPVIACLMVFSLGFSYVWLHYFQFGPLEWVWRSMTYGKILPNRKPKASLIIES